MADDFCNGKYLQVIAAFDGLALSNSALLDQLSRIDSTGSSTTLLYKQVHDMVLSFILDGDHTAKVTRTFECLLLGISYLELYCQTNYTGPELPPAQLEVFQVNGAACVQELECDGTYAFRSIELPQTLLLARIILSTLAEPHAAGWKEGIALDSKGGVSRRLLADAENILTLTEERLVLKSIVWWSARAAVVHLRLLQKQSYEDVPTLWNEVTTKFTTVLNTFSSLPAGTSLLLVTTPLSDEDSREERNSSKETGATTTATNANAQSSAEQPPLHHAGLGSLPDRVLCMTDFADQLIASTTTSTTTSTEGTVTPAPTELSSSSESVSVSAAAWESLRRQLGAQAWLEWGLCCLHFSHSDKVILRILFVHSFKRVQLNVCIGCGCCIFFRFLRHQLPHQTDFITTFLFVLVRCLKAHYLK